MVSLGAQDTLHAAARCGDAASLRRLMAQGGADGLEDRDGKQRTALMRAAAYGHCEAVAALLEAGASYDAAGPQGWTALMYAAAHGQTAVARKLLLARGDPAAVDSEDGRVALHQAASGGHTATCAALLVRGAEACARDLAGRIPVDCARASQCAPCADFLTACSSELPAGGLCVGTEAVTMASHCLVLPNESPQGLELVVEVLLDAIQAVAGSRLVAVPETRWLANRGFHSSGVEGAGATRARTPLAVACSGDFLRELVPPCEAGEVDITQAFLGDATLRYKVKTQGYVDQLQVLSDGTAAPLVETALVVAVRHPSDAVEAVEWLSTAGLARLRLDGGCLDHSVFGPCVPDDQAAELPRESLEGRRVRLASGVGEVIKHNQAGGQVRVRFDVEAGGRTTWQPEGDVLEVLP